MAGEGKKYGELRNDFDIISALNMVWMVTSCEL